MTEVIDIECPFCGELFAIQPTLADGRYETVEDCMICCRPVHVTVGMRAGECVSLCIERS